MSDEHRVKIANSNILNALIEHAQGEREMSATQVAAATTLLRKVLPDLSAVEQDVTHNVSDELADLLNAIDSKTRGVPLANGHRPTATSH